MNSENTANTKPDAPTNINSDDSKKKPVRSFDPVEEEARIRKQEEQNEKRKEIRARIKAEKKAEKEGQATGEFDPDAESQFMHPEDRDILVTQDQEQKPRFNYMEIVRRWSAHIEPARCCFDLSEKSYFWYVADKGLWVESLPEEIMGRLSTYLEQLARYNAQVPPITESTLRSLLRMIRTQFGHRNIFGQPRTHIHVRNGYINLLTGAETPIGKDSHEMFSRNQIPVTYVAGADCPEFRNFLMELFGNSDDVAMFQRLAGQALLGRNIVAAIYILIGPGGCGKSTLLFLVILFLGEQNCAYYDPDSQNQFEFANYAGKLLLYNADCPGNVLEKKSANLKRLSGDEIVTGNRKGEQGQICLQGKFPIYFSMNGRFRICLDGDDSAWERRIQPQECLPAPLGRKGKDGYERILVEREGPGILNFFLDGLQLLFKEVKENGTRLRRTKRQQQRVDQYLGESNPVKTFVTERLFWAPGYGPGIVVPDPGLDTSLLMGDEVEDEGIEVEGIVFASSQGSRPPKLSDKEQQDFSSTCREIKEAFDSEFYQPGPASEMIKSEIRKRFRITVRNDVIREGKEKSGWVGITLIPPQQHHP